MWEDRAAADAEMAIQLLVTFYRLLSHEVLHQQCPSSNSNTSKLYQQAAQPTPASNTHSLLSLLLVLCAYLLIRSPTPANAPPPSCAQGDARGTTVRHARNAGHPRVCGAPSPGGARRSRALPRRDRRGRPHNQWRGGGAQTGGLSIGKRMASTRQALGKHTANTPQAHGKHTASTRQAHGKHTASAWQAHGKHMASTPQAHHIAS